MTFIPFRYHCGLLYIPVRLEHCGQTVTLQNCIFDTGSGGTVFDTDVLHHIGITYRPDSRIKRLATVGGYQRVFTHPLKMVVLGDQSILNVEIEVGDLQSQFKIDGIFGTDLIQRFNWELNFSTNRLILIKR